MITIYAHFDGRFIVPDGPVELPTNRKFVVHIEGTSPADDGEAWSDAKNLRRCDLIDKDIMGCLSDDEHAELDRLEGELQAYLRIVAPLPLNDLRELHDELLDKAAIHSR